MLTFLHDTCLDPGMSGCHNGLMHIQSNAYSNTWLLNNLTLKGAVFSFLFIFFQSRGVNSRLYMLLWQQNGMFTSQISHCATF